MSIEQLFSSPQYYPTVIRSTGLLSGEERKDRIEKILAANAWLAARCKNTSVLEEKAIKNAIVENCKALFADKQEAVSIVTLLELGEIDTVCALLHMNRRVGIELSKDSNQSVPHLFCKLGQNFTFRPFWPVYNKIEELGYPMDLELYNLALSKLPKEGDPRSILNRMELSGIDASARTYYLLIQKSTTYQGALIFFNLLLGQKCEDSIINDALCEMISMAPSKGDVEQLFRYARLGPSEFATSRRVEITYHSRMIALANNCQELIESLESFSKWFSINSSTKEHLFSIVVPFYCEGLDRIPYDHELLLKSISLFLDISCIGHPGSSYFNYVKRGKAQNRRLLIETFKKMMPRIGPSSMLFELFSIISSHNIRLDSDLIWSAIEIADTSDYLQRLLDRFRIKTPSSRQVLDLLNRYNEETAKCFYDYLSENDFTFSIDHYYALMDKVSFEKALDYSYEMEKHGVTATSQTIQRLLYLFTNRSEFKAVFVFASHVRLLPNTWLLYALKRRAVSEKFIKDIVLSLSIHHIEHLEIDSQWKRFLMDAQNKLRREIN